MLTGRMKAPSRNCRDLVNGNLSNCGEALYGEWRLFVGAVPRASRAYGEACWAVPQLPSPNQAKTILILFSNVEGDDRSRNVPGCSGKFPLERDLKAGVV